MIVRKRPGGHAIDVLESRYLESQRQNDRKGPPIADLGDRKSRWLSLH